EAVLVAVFEGAGEFPWAELEGDGFGLDGIAEGDGGELRDDSGGFGFEAGEGDFAEMAGGEAAGGAGEGDGFLDAASGDGGPGERLRSIRRSRRRGGCLFRSSGGRRTGGGGG